jgi:hypothetical protein
MNHEKKLRNIENENNLKLKLAKRCLLLLLHQARLCLCGTELLAASKEFQNHISGDKVKLW